MPVLSSRKLALVGGLAAMALLAPSRRAGADWLVMKDGSGRVETKGPWEVRGATVVFYRPDGSLASLRASDVDLDASKTATEAAAQPTPAPAPTPKPEEKKAIVTITDKDVAHVDPETVAAEQAAAQAAAQPGATPTPAPAQGATPPDRVQVAHWNQDLEHSQDGVVLIGEVVNVSSDVVGSIVVSASLFDDQGKLLASADALLGSDALSPNQKTSLRVTFPGVYNFTEAKFQVKSAALKSAPAPG